MKIILSLLLFIICILPSLSYGEEINAGFVQGIWFSSEEVFAEQPTRIYIALRNNTKHELTGTVYFTDNGSRIGSSNVNALSGRLVEAWVDWKPRYGNHKLSASLQNTELHPIGEDVREANVASTLAESDIFVDHDTDNDGVGNDNDSDDDNDDISDLEEKVTGSDPLVPNPKPRQDESTSSSTNTGTSSTPTSEPEPESPAPTAEGLEKYTEDGSIDSLLKNVTEKVNGAKQSLDAYRAERNKADEAGFISVSTDTATMTPLGTYTENATPTITRTTIEKEGTLWNSFIEGALSLIHSIWTGILWILSKILAHPEIVQIFILLTILYVFYRIARRIGRRPNF